MGIVIKQSFWSSLWAYVGVALGYLSTLVLLPAFMSMEQIGVFRLVMSNALLVAPFITLGMPGTYLKFFPEFRNNQALDKQIFSFQLFLIGLAATLSCIGILYFKDAVESYFSNTPEYILYLAVSLFILVFHTFFLQLHAYCKSHLDIIVPNFLKEVYLRAGNIFIIGLYALEFITFNQLVNSLAYVYGSSVMILVIFLIYKHHFSISSDLFSIPKKWFKEMAEFSSFNLALAASNSIYTNISFAMIASTLGAGLNGIFTICFYLGIIIEMPKRSMSQIISPILSNAAKRNDLQEIETLYKRASLTLGTVALLFFIGITCNLNDLFQIIPQGENIRVGVYVVFAVGISKIIDMVFSINSDIIVYSKYYKFNLYFFIPTALLIVVFNYFFLPTLGINGAGLAFLLSTVIFNVVKFIFIWNKFQITPFTRKHLLLLLLSAILGFIFWVLPFFGKPILDIIIRSITITLSYIVLIYHFKISDDINTLIRTLFKKYLDIKLP